MALSKPKTDPELAKLIRQTYEALAFYYKCARERGIEVKTGVRGAFDNQFDPATDVIITKMERL